MTYIEQDCTFEHNGRKFTEGGAYYDGQHAVGYVGKPVEPSRSIVRALTN